MTNDVKPQEPENLADHFTDTGYPVKEALTRSQKWWEEWRSVIPAKFNLRKEAPTVRAATGMMPGIIIQGHVEQDLPDGILSGKKWEELTDPERLIVVKTWHHYQVRVPMLDADVTMARMQ